MATVLTQRTNFSCNSIAIAMIGFILQLISVKASDEDPTPTDASGPPFSLLDIVMYAVSGAAGCLLIATLCCTCLVCHYRRKDSITRRLASVLYRESLSHTASASYCNSK